MNIAATNLLIEDHIISGLARSYNTLDYAITLKSMLNPVFPNLDFANYTKFDLHKIINETICNNYNGEDVLKYNLFTEFATKRVVAAFEIKVNNSRVDFLTINGSSKSFEIKSAVDNLQKLKKQVADYIRVFEYNLVVIDEKHLEKALSILPESYGIWSFDGKKKKVHRSEKLNTKLDSEFQLKLLTKKELNWAFNDHSISRIQSLYTEEKINYLFKIVLKERYKIRWEFIVNNNSKILPIDLQFFFNTNVLPEIIYQH